VRYGNVVGSRGSVVPFFRGLLAQNARELPITDTRMTRFWITLQQGVDFVLDNFKRMHGGETFVPKIPSSRITDLAEAIAPGLPHKVVGIRPGEKLHEVMCPRDDYHLTLDFPAHYVIKPSINMGFKVDYATSKTGESSKPVVEDFEYSSGTNPHFLSVPEIRRLLEATA
jgi:UDP-N-acetylglucosamine 4,6-dehydratase